MERRRLGRTGMIASVLGFGGSEIGYDRVAVRTVERLLGSALDAGLTVIDTAQCYEGGLARYIGYSGDGAAARYAVECGRFDTLQTSISIADQEAIDLTLPLARARKMGVIAKRPLANTAWRYRRRPESYYADYWERLRHLDYPFVRDTPPSAAGIALRFTLSAPRVHTATAGP